MPRMAHGRPEPWLTGDIPSWCRVGMPVEPFRPPPRLLDRVRDALRLRHRRRRTERAYVGWIRRCILFHGKRHPAEMGAEEVSRFLSSLAVEAQVSASTQNQALAAIQPALRHHLDRVRQQHGRDVRAGAG